MSGAGGFLVQIETAGGFPLLAGGLCASGAEAVCRQHCRAVLGALRWSGRESIVMADRKLADAASRLALPELWVLGLSLALPGMEGRTGGVLGSPHLPPRPAEGVLEPLGQDFWLLARPGGPGVAARGDPDRLRGLAEGMAGGEPEGWAARLRQAGLLPFLLVTDGSGPGARGGIWLGLETTTERRTLPPMP